MVPSEHIISELFRIRNIIYPPTALLPTFFIGFIPLTTREGYHQVEEIKSRDNCKERGYHRFILDLSVGALRVEGESKDTRPNVAGLRTFQGNGPRYSIRKAPITFDRILDTRAEAMFTEGDRHRSRPQGYGFDSLANKHITGLTSRTSALSGRNASVDSS
jgi:hypothetical protein